MAFDKDRYRPTSLIRCRMLRLPQHSSFHGTLCPKLPLTSACCNISSSSLLHLQTRPCRVLHHIHVPMHHCAVQASSALPPASSARRSWLCVTGLSA